MHQIKPTLLIAEDDPVQMHGLATLLSKTLGYTVIQAENGKEAIKRIESSPIGEISAVLLDMEMPVMDGFDALKAIRKFRPDLPVLMLADSQHTDGALRAIKEGASDFIVKPANPSHIEIAIHNAIRLAALSRELAKLRRDKEGALSFSDLVGHSAGLAEAVAYGRKAAASDVPILITGETGAGKEFFARAIHGESKRVGGPFITLNCGTIPENLVDSTLFGHEKGAFTGATTRALGKFREAEGGTIFLDEIGELPLEAQVKLMRLLQQKEVEPVGAKPVKVNVRVIAATNRDMRRDVETRRFREDLYARLNVLPITVPPLRERKQDILSLADYFIQRLAAEEALPVKSLTHDAQHYMVTSTWPGNVRELENLIHRALVLSEGENIDRAALTKIHETNNSVPVVERRATPPLHLNLCFPDGRFKTMAEIESEAMSLALAYFENNVTRAAESLDIAKSTFYRKIKDAAS